jgi:hypothetical protein
MYFFQKKVEILAPAIGAMGWVNLRDWRAILLAGKVQEILFKPSTQTGAAKMISKVYRKLGGKIRKFTTSKNRKRFMTVDTRNIHMTAIDKAVVNTLQKFVDEELSKFPEICTAADVFRSGQSGFGINLTIKMGEREVVRRFIGVDVWQKQPFVVVHAIVTPSELAHHGLGKRLIWQLFQSSLANGHELIIVDLVPSFMRRLLARGALKLDGDDVKITKDTNLN